MSDDTLAGNISIGAGESDGIRYISNGKNQQKYTQEFKQQIVDIYNSGIH